MAPRTRNALTFLGYGLLLALIAVGVLLVVNRRPQGQSVVLPPTPRPVRFSVTGELPAGSIVLDAITAAGGLLPPRANRPRIGKSAATAIRGQHAEDTVARLSPTEVSA